MAEHVQSELDQMVLPLLDLQERSVFTSDEIHAILTRRRESEYKLQRRHAQKADFISYLQAEMNLEQLRELRSKKLLKAAAAAAAAAAVDKKKDLRDHPSNKNNKKKKHIGDKHIVQLVHRLFTRTLRKFKSDVALYLQYADFCKSTKSYTKLSSLYAQALQFHPKSPVLWLEAASHEYFTNNSLANARILLQRGIRHNPTLSGQQLWIQSFALELHFVQKLRGRKHIILGGGTSTDDSDNDNTEQEKEEARDNPKKEQVTVEDLEQQHKLAKLVYTHAIQAIHDSIDFRLEFLEQCRQFPSTHDLQDHIMATIQRDFHNSTQAWIAQAQYHQYNNKNKTGGGDEPLKKRPRLDKQTNRGNDDDDDDVKVDAASASWTDPVLQILRKATMTIPSPEMYLQAIQFINSCLDDDNDDDDDFEDSDNDEEGGVERTREKECLSFLDTLFQEAAATAVSADDASSTDAPIQLYSSAVVLEHVDHLVHRLDQVGAAVQVLENFVAANKNKMMMDDDDIVSIWMQWAALVFYSSKTTTTGQNEPTSSSSSKEKAIGILRKGLNHIPIDKPGHLVLLLQLVGAHLTEPAAYDNDNYDDEEQEDGAITGTTTTTTTTSTEPILQLLERILMLYPGFVEMPVMEDSPFGIKSVPDAFIECLRFVQRSQGLDGARRVCRMVLFQSNFAKYAVQTNPEGLELFLDEALAAGERSATTISTTKANTNDSKQILELYDFAIRAFQGTNLAEGYQQRRDVYVMCGMHSNPQGSTRFSGRPAVPVFDIASPDFSPAAFLKAFQVFQVVRLQNAVTPKRRKDAVSWRDIGPIFERLERDQESWCVETKGGGEISPTAFLKPKVSDARGYCSFLIQKDVSSFKEVASKLPLSGFPWTDWAYEPALWVFFGRNPCGNPEMEGRPEHSDAVAHDGTWHYQLSGRKQWLLRPSSALLQHLTQHLSASERSEWNEGTRLGVDCREGDVIVVNTKLWFHKTMIPPQKRPSVSCARDFCVESRLIATKETGGMTNLDGLYATNDIEVGTIIFKESGMPDCELHRSSNPNCEVVELEDGTSAIVSTRTIASGEFFTVAESGDEDEDEEEEDGDASDE